MFNRLIQKMNILKKWWLSIIFWIIGTSSLVWFLVRVIPKPSRAAYPCMRAAAPLASTFVLYLLGVAASITAFSKARISFKNTRYVSALLLLFVCIVAGGFAFTQLGQDSYADQDIEYVFNDPLGPNNPIGEARGVIPGRVVWIFDPKATNENCTNANLADAYFLDKNTDQDVIDNMYQKGLLSLTGEETLEDAWDAVFKYFNVEHDKGEVGYQDDETIFIKINAVSAWSGIGYTGDMRRLGNDSDTTPQVILAILRHLVNIAGVPQENIYIGDPIAGIWNHVYNKLAAEFPNVNYMDAEAKVEGRTKLEEAEDFAIIYSDKNEIMTQDSNFKSKHKLYKSMMNADYLINIPSMKGHRWGGVTLFAKNHFGSNTSGNSWGMHTGLMKAGDNDPVRTGYSQYRVLTDLMGSKYLGRNTLIFIMDGLWSTSYEHQLPQKFTSQPFNNNWSSSMLFSLDHVAISSVCIDILQKEFTEEDMTADPPRHTYVQWDGVDDYLHQAASSEWWPDSVIYDPDDSGTPMTSMGVHEHWNNVDDMQYSRDLGTGEGIELIKYFENETSVKEEAVTPMEMVLLQNYPNPFNPGTTIQVDLIRNSHVTLDIFSVLGEKVVTLADQTLQAGTHHYTWQPNNLPSGTYYIRLNTGDQVLTKKCLYIK